MSRAWIFLVVLLACIVLDDARRARGRRRYPGRRGMQNDDRYYRWIMRHFPRGYGSNWNRSYRWMFDFGRQRNWYDGPNVCTHKTETNDTVSDGNSFGKHSEVRTTICDDRGSAYRCEYSITKGGIKQKVLEVKECCFGFSRRMGDYGCPTTIRLQNVVQTARDLNLNELIGALQTVNLDRVILEGNFTVFAPTDEAFAMLGEQPMQRDRYMNANDMGSVVRVSRPMADQAAEDLRNILLNHVTTKVLTTGRLNDEQLIETAGPTNSKIRVNFYDGKDKLMTANCKRVRSQDNRASNGVIHIVEEVMLPVSDSMVDIVTKDRQLSYLKTAIGRSSLGQALRADGQLTLFAPTDSAFQKLDSDVLNRLLRDQKCLDKVLKNHVLPNVVCSSAIQGKSRTKNLLMRYLSVNRDQEDKVFVQDSQVVSADIMATNGVIHLIDEVLIPDDALGILDVAEKQNATKVLELIDRAGLRKTLESAENITFFVPTNEAVEKLPSDVLTSLARDTNALANILKYHVTPVETECKFVYNGYELETLSSGKSIVLYEYSTFPFRQRWLQTAQCGRIIMGNIPSCNGLIHLVDKVLIPPVGNILDVLAQDRRFTQLVDLLKRAGLADALQGEGPLTIFAPTNQAFGKIPSSTLQSLASDVDQLQTVLKLHVIKGFLCCAGIFEDNFFHRSRISSLAGTRLRIRKGGDQLLVQSSTISSCDLTGTNGVVHAIDSVILPNQKQRDRSWYGYYYN